MPVEIKELIIRITDTSQEPIRNTESIAQPMNGLVEAIVKQVLKILEKKQKR